MGIETKSKSKKQKVDPKNLHLEHWKIHKINPLSNILLNGKKNTGKTTVIGSLIYNMTTKGRGRIPRICVMSGTEEYSHQYGSKYKIRKQCIANGFDEKFLTIIYEKQKKKAKKYGGNKPEHGVLLILEDLAFDVSFYKHPIIKEMIFNGRWLNMALIVVVQEPVKFPKDYRSNLEYAITTRENMPQQRKNLYDFYFGVFNSYEEFEQCLVRNTRNYHVMVYDNTLNEGIARKVCFKYKAPLCKTASSSRRRGHYRHRRRDKERRRRHHHRDDSDSSGDDNSDSDSDDDDSSSNENTSSESEDAD